MFSNGSAMRRIEEKLDSIAKDTSEVKNDMTRISERLQHTQDKQQQSDQELKELNREIDNITGRLTTAESEIKELRRYSTVHKKRLDEQEDDNTKARPFIGGLKWLTERAAIAGLAILATVVTQNLNLKQESLSPSAQVTENVTTNQKQYMA